MYDIIIIGSGPAGLTAAIYASRAQLTAVVLEKDYLGSGQIAVSEQVDNYPGLPGIDGYTLGEKFREHAKQLGAKFENVEVDHIKQTAEGFTVFCKEGEPLQSRTILCASGTSYRRLDVPGGTLQGVSYCATLGDAMYLSRMAKKVYLVHRRQEFRANQALQTAVQQNAAIELVLDAVPTAVLGEKRVDHLELLQNGASKTLPVDGVFVAIGSIPNTDFLGDLCKLDESGYILADETGVTSTPGVFAAGDVRTTPLRQVVTAVADGANCVQSIEQYFRKGNG